MNNLRENTGVILWILVFSFGVIWVLQDSNVFDTMNRQPTNVAVVNGSEIAYEEYQNVLQQQRQRYRQQMDGEISPGMDEMIEEQAYNQLVTRELIRQEMKRMGIEVTKQEILDMVYGPNPHPMIRRQFADSTGRIDYALLDNLAQNPEMSEQWLAFENMLRETRRDQKLQTIVQATVHVSEQDVRERYVADSSSASVRYVAQRYATIPDDSITVTDADLRDYYEANKEDFKQPKTYTVEYASAPKIATASDTALVVDALNDLKDEFAQAENDSLFLEENDSRRSYSDEYQTPAEMEEPIATALYSDLEPGRVAGPIFANDLAHLVKVIDTQESDEGFRKARHILLREKTDANRETLVALKDSIDSTEDFARFAREYSEDSSAPQGGDLGWFTRDKMVDVFSDAAFGNPTGEVIGPIESRFGYHLIWVDAAADRAVKYADLAFSLTPSPASLTEQEQKLEDVAYFTEEGGTFAEEAEELDFEAREVQIEAEQTNIPGIGQSRSIADYLDGASAGEVSPVFELNESFVVLQVNEVQEERYRPLEDVSSQIRPRVEVQKKKEVLKAQMQQALRQGGSLDALASALNTRVRTKTDVTLSTNTAPGIGRDPAFAGTVFGLSQGQRSGVMTGENAAFVVEVTSMRVPSELTAQQRQQIRQRLKAQRQRQVAQQWVASLRDRADITDNRSAFGR